MPEQSQNVADAESALASLEKHRQTAAAENFRAHRALSLMAMHGDQPEIAAKYKAEHDEHRKKEAEALNAHADSGVTQRDIDIAAQAVLDARGERHTETGTLHSEKKAS